MNHSAFVYRCRDFDGRIYVKIHHQDDIRLASVVLLRNDQTVAKKDTPEEFVMFKGNDAGTYKALVELTLHDDSVVVLESNVIVIDHAPMPQAAALYPPAQNVKGSQRIYDNVPRHYLELKLQKGCLGKLLAEPAQVLPKSHGLICDGALAKVSLKAYWEDEEDQNDDEKACDRYVIERAIADDELIAVAQELETLDYVIYCAVVPDCTGMEPPELPLSGFDDEHVNGGPLIDAESGPQAASNTPNFTNRQTYMAAPQGMNVLAAWANGHRGRSATVRLIDFGIYRRHEDLFGNVTVVNSRPEYLDCNHGTASTGCISGIANAFGVNGIANECRFFFYESGDIGLVLNQAVPGDIVMINVQFVTQRGLLPVIDNLRFWENIRTLTMRGVTVLAAAGNGGLDLSPAARILQQFGDSGGMLVGGSDIVTGARLNFSNHSHSTSLVNSWGRSVTTTGYGYLFGRGNNNRSYTGNYNGTSSATPLTGGALALIQSYAISRDSFLLPAAFRTLLDETGYPQGRGDGIGSRPNVMGAILALARDSDITPPPDPLPPPDPVPPPGNSYRIDTRAQFARLETDAAGNYLRQQLQTFSRVEIAVRDGAHAPRVVFPQASQVANGREISFATQASWGVILQVNGNAFPMSRGSAQRFVLQNQVWRLFNSYLANTAAQLGRIGNDANGNYLLEQLRRFDAVEVATRNGVWATQIVFPNAAQLAPGRSISFVTGADWDTTLIVNGQRMFMRNGQAAYFFVENGRWRQ